MDKALILVVDDDPDICTMIKVMLDFNGYTAIDANNESEALQLLASQKIQLIIMDMLLSGADGTDICRRLKKDPAYAGIPVLMFSAHPNAMTACLAAGADDFIAKPFEMTDILEKIATLLENNPVNQA